MKTRILIMAVVEKDGTILMRKKAAGSKPYTETWYIFGTDVEIGIDPDATLLAYLKEKVGIDAHIERHITRGSEVKEDTDGEIKQFIYLDTLCRYIDGEPILPAGAEKIERVLKNDLSSYDIVPPSIELFTKLGYL